MAKAIAAKAAPTSSPTSAKGGTRPLIGDPLNLGKLIAPKTQAARLKIGDVYADALQDEIGEFCAADDLKHSNLYRTLEATLKADNDLTCAAFTAETYAYVITRKDATAYHERIRKISKCDHVFYVEGKDAKSADKIAQALYEECCG